MEINIRLSHDSNPEKSARLLRNLAAALDGSDVSIANESEITTTEDKPKASRSRSSKAADAPKDTRTNEEAAKDLSASIAAANEANSEAAAPLQPIKLEYLVSLGQKAAKENAANRPTLAAILESFGAQSFSQLKEEHFADVRRKLLDLTEDIN